MFGFNKRGILNITNVTFGFRGKESVNSVPVNTVAPKVTGNTNPLDILTCTDGTWIGTPVITFTYQWFLDGLPIIGEVSTEYEIKTSDLNKTIYCEVYATNDFGTLSAQSNTISVSEPSLQFNSIFNSQYYSIYFG